MADFTPQEIEQFLQEFFDVVGARQYVGARYVPIFGRAGEDTVEWDDGAPYEPLTVVMHEGVSYVSRRYVPNGIQITDTAYWVETYRFNAQVEQYRQEVLSYDDRINGAYDAIDTLRDQVTDDYVPFPDPLHYPKFGTLGQVLSTLADGQTRWVDPVVPSDAQAEAVITEWLADHPEATTTVQDGAITRQKLASSLDDVIMTYQASTNAGNYQTLLPTLADAKLNSVYVLSQSSSGHQADYPTAFGYPTALMFTWGFSGYRSQIMYDPVVGKRAVRAYFGNAWHDWSVIEQIPDGAITRQKLASALDDVIMTYQASTNAGNYQTLLPTLADAKLNSIYIVSQSSSGHQADYPTAFGYPTAIMYTWGQTGARRQVMWEPETGKRAVRAYFGNAWHDWSVLFEHRNTITIAPSGGDYTNIVSGLNAAYGTGNTDVIVRAGTYDIVAAEQALHGSGYFEDESFSAQGTQLGHGCKYYFESGSLVRCVLPSTASAAAQNMYSLFNVGDGDFEVLGLHAYSENCRYTIHDDMGHSTPPYHHVYKDCYLHHNDTGAGYPQCIGGGLGTHGLIDVEGCVFESDTAEGNTIGIVSWHNTVNAGMQSFVNIRDCYFKNGHVRFSWYGASTDISVMTVCGCSFDTRAIEEGPENSGALIENTDVIAWNNEIRNP